MNRPSRLYKYEAFSTQSLLNLKRQIVYFGSPLNFNDPYDCALSPAIAPMSDADVERFRDRLMHQAGTLEALRERLRSSDPEELRATILRAGRQGFDNEVQNFLTSRGVACFSRYNNNLLMWSHYGGKCKGFCLEFDTSARAFEHAQAVRYVPVPPTISIETYLFDPSFSPIQELFCTKSTVWEYEAEWRALHVKAGTEFRYQASALTGVYFGPDMDQDSLEIICLILRGQNASVQLWRGSRSKNEFKVEFEPITYTSHLEASASPANMP